MERWFTRLPSSAARHAVFIAMAVALPTSASFAQGTRAQRMACTGDVWRLCSSAIPNVNNIVSCLQRQKSRLSPGCAAVFNDPQVETAINGRSQQPAAAAPPNPQAETTFRAQPEQTATTPPASADVASQQTGHTLRSLTPATGNEAAAQAASGQSSTIHPVAMPPTQSTQQVATGDADASTQGTSRHGRRQHVAYQGSGHYRYARHGGGIMARIGQFAPLLSMIGGGQGGGFDIQSMMGGGYGGGYGGGGMDIGSMMSGFGGGQGGMDIGSMMSGFGGGQGGMDIGSMMSGMGGGRGGFNPRQLMGMARGMGIDPSSFMGGWH